MCFRSVTYTDDHLLITGNYQAKLIKNTQTKQTVSADFRQQDRKLPFPDIAPGMRCTRHQRLLCKCKAHQTASF